MRYTQLSAFDKHLQGAAPHHLASLYCIIGKNSFDCREALNRLLMSIFPDSNQRTLSTQTLDGAQLTVALLLAELNSQQLFGGKRILHIYDVDKCEKTITTKLESYFAQPDPSLFLILSASSLSRASNFYKKAEMAGVILEFAEEKPWEKEKTIVTWIASQVAQAGKKISPSTAQHLVKLLGTEMSSLHGELQKLFCYVGSRSEITPKDLEAIITTANIDNGWQLGEALLQRKTAPALRICRALFTEGTAPIALLRQVRSQFQTSYQVCSVLTNGGSPADVSALYPYMRGKLLEHHCLLATSFGLKRFKAAMLKIDQTEWMTKSSSQAPEVLVELLIMQLTAH